MVEEEEAPSVDEKNSFLGELLINLFIPSPNPGIDWIFWTPA